MKVIKHGYTSEMGICVTCPTCSCEFVIEDKNDWLIEWKRDVNNNDYTCYNVRCPECGKVIYLGTNPNKVIPNLPVSQFSSMFNRKDWDRRYDIS